VPLRLPMNLLLHIKIKEQTYKDSESDIAPLMLGEVKGSKKVSQDIR
jgi:hypothetical protein